jgi:hypothetical protein
MNDDGAWCPISLFNAPVPVRGSDVDGLDTSRKHRILIWRQDGQFSQIHKHEYDTTTERMA